MRRGSRQKSRARLISRLAFAIHNAIREIRAARADERPLGRIARSPFADATRAGSALALLKQRRLERCQSERRTTTSPLRKRGKLKRRPARKSSRWRNG